MRKRGELNFRARLTLLWTIVFSCVLAAASVAIFFGIRQASYAELDRHLRTLASTDVVSAFDQPISPHVHDLPTSALAGGRFTEKLVQVFDTRHRMVVASQGRAQQLQFVDDRLLAAGLMGDAPIRTVNADGLPIRVVVLARAHDGQTYAFAVGVIISELIESLAHVQHLLLLVWLVSTAATAAVGFALASTALRPVRHITRRAMEIAASDAPARLEVPTVHDEIGAMTRSLNSLIERLQQALEANRRFASDAAHELRSPVTAMAGEIDVTLRRQRTAEEYRETLQLVRERLTSLGTIIADLMLLVRAQERRHTLVRQDVPLASLLGAAIRTTAGMAALRDVQVTMEPFGGLVVRGEPGLLEHVFGNVLENAIRYNYSPGSVRLSATTMAAGRVAVRIEDSGPGIPEADRDRVFDRFYRVDTSRSRHTGGAGLGLAIAREVLAVFDGVIRIERSSDRGTTVLIDMPGSDRGAAGTLPAAS